jgi:hypothetical protein
MPLLLSLLRTFSTILGAALLTVLNSVSLELSANDVVTNTG